MTYFASKSKILDSMIQEKTGSAGSSKANDEVQECGSDASK